MKRLAIPLVASLLLGVFGASAMAQDAPPPPPKAMKAGDAVPAWKTKELGSGTEVSSEMLKGDDYALVFVNSSCASCRSELSELKKREFKNLKVYVLSVDANPEKALTVYKESLSVPFPILDDSTLAVSDVFDFAFTPASVIVKKGNVLDKRFVGFSKRIQGDITKAFDAYAK